MKGLVASTLLCAAVASFAASDAAAQATPASPGLGAGETIWLPAATHRLKARAYTSRAHGEHPVLVVVLHGDSPFANPSYQYRFARVAAEQNDDVVTVGLLRPGYTDSDGEKSDGERGRTTGDNYTPAVIDDVIAAVEQLKTRFAARAAVLVGHSGGAAIAADVIGTAPDLAAGALLVSCPCDLRSFRWHMFRLQWSPFWLLPVDSVSPLSLAGQVRATKVRLLVGADDELTPQRFSFAYADALKACGADASVAVVAGQPHDMLLETPTFDALSALIKQVGAQ